MVGSPSRRARRAAARRVSRLRGDRLAVARPRGRALVAVIAASTLPGLLLGGVILAVARNIGSADVTTTSSTLAPQPVDLRPAKPGRTLEGPTPCPPLDGSAPRTTRFSSPPPMCIDPSQGWQAVLETDLGDVTILLGKRTPKTVNNFVVLALYHFYDDVPFHLIDPGNLVATGDATGDPPGTGGPGYTIPDEIPKEGVIYPPMTVAMWHDGTKKDQNGSQFLVATGPRAAGLPPFYTPFGTVTRGDDTLRRIEDHGTAGTGAPTRDIRIRRVRVSRVSQETTVPSRVDDTKGES